MSCILGNIHNNVEPLLDGLVYLGFGGRKLIDRHKERQRTDFGAGCVQLKVCFAEPS